MTLPVLLACFALDPAPTPTADERRFLVPVEELLALGNGQRRAFRFRTTSFAPERVPDGPVRVRDGLLKLELDATGVLLEELSVEYDEQEGPWPAYETRRERFSVSTGELVRCSLYDGNPWEFASLEYWTGLPAIVYFSLGFVGPSPSEVFVRHGVESLDDSTFEAVYGSRAGNESVRLRFRDGDDAGVLEMNVLGDEGQHLMNLSFLGEDRSLPGAPVRPTEIVETYYTPDGRLGRVTAWTLVEGGWADEPVRRAVPKGTHVSDLRVEHSHAVETHLELDIDRLSSWFPEEMPHPLVVQEEPESPSSLFAEPESPSSSDGDLLALGGAVGAAATLILVLRLRRS